MNFLRSLNMFFFLNQRLMEKDVESRLREKYALIDKNDVEQLAEAQKVILHFKKII